MKVVVVESPSKAKTINKYLGPDYKVLASYGHIRDLPSRNGSVDPEKKFNMVWEVDDKAERHINEILKSLKGADQLLLATDPDREGEAISWHVKEVLDQKKALINVDVKRVVFYEVTKKAILEAVKQPRSLNQELIEAYLARRALDYLVGFTLSPILWRKLPGSRSAGRVQSVALRLTTEREDEIEAFRSQEYWTISAEFLGQPQKQLRARLTHLEGKKLDKFDLSDQSRAQVAQTEIEKHLYKVLEVEKKQAKRHPSPPFTTSTLQQEASRKLGFSAKKTMQLAQHLYEGFEVGGETVGLITYMRTDSVNLAQEALFAVRDLIKQQYGSSYCPEAPRAYKSKAKNAQEAHEAIRPTDLTRAPNMLKSVLDADHFKLYELIWKRTIASQMESALLDQVGVDIANPSKEIILRATGSTIAFDGYLKVYEEGKDDEASEQEQILPPLVQGEDLKLQAVHPEQHFTQPPPRYTEASLVKKLEELGIGRPSTYASIISTLIDRKYVVLEKKRLKPEPLGRLVTAFLKNYFAKYIEYDFTAHLEEELDEISMGKLSWFKVLEDFWKQFYATVEQASPLKIADVITQLEKDLEKLIFIPMDGTDDPRQCPQCKEGKLNLKLGKWGAFVGCSNYPTCGFTRKLSGALKEEEVQAGESAEKEAPKNMFEPKTLGTDPVSKAVVSLRKGPYGFYLQWDGEEQLVSKPTKGKGKKADIAKPKRVAIPKGRAAESITLEDALALGALPRTVGTHPETGKPITAAIGRFGPYVKHESTFKSIGKEDDVLTVTLARALELFSQESEKKKPFKKKS
ncbi:MAG: DNA topoisomerase I [Caedibacter sp. 38-128]|nr:type I DNA topoisomerase [Holosporales bacterium]OJX07237.1 MAG: DNA topoisomerase I [Caedibacter sp. 38-128]